MTTPIEDIEPGKRVAWQTRPSAWTSLAHRGEVKRKTDSTVWVQPDRGGDLVTFRANRTKGVELHVLTAHELAIEGWKLLEPTTAIVSVHEDERRGYAVRLDERAARAEGKSVTEVLAQIGDECARVTRWLADRPTPPDQG